MHYYSCFFASESNANLNWKDYIAGQTLLKLIVQSPFAHDGPVYHFIQLTYYRAAVNTCNMIVLVINITFDFIHILACLKDDLR